MDTQPSISEIVYRIANGAQFLIGGPPDSKGHGANMGPHVGPMNFAIWGPSLLLDWIPFTDKDHIYYKVVYDDMNW